MSEDECSDAFKYEDLEAKFKELNLTLKSHFEKHEIQLEEVEDELEEVEDELEEHEETHHDLMKTKIENAKLEKQIEYEKFKSDELTKEIIKARDPWIRTNRSRTRWSVSGPVRIEKQIISDHFGPGPTFLKNFGPTRTGPGPKKNKKTSDQLGSNGPWIPDESER